MKGVYYNYNDYCTLVKNTWQILWLW
jgi:hypothetical protein